MIKKKDMFFFTLLLHPLSILSSVPLPPSLFLVESGHCFLINTWRVWSSESWLRCSKGKNNTWILYTVCVLHRLYFISKIFFLFHPVGCSVNQNPDFHFTCKISLFFVQLRYLKWHIFVMSDFYHLLTKNLAFHSTHVNVSGSDFLKGDGWLLLYRWVQEAVGWRKELGQIVQTYRTIPFQLKTNKVCTNKYCVLGVFMRKLISEKSGWGLQPLSSLCVSTI